MLSLKSAHLFVVALGIIVTAGFGMWGVLHAYRAAGMLSLGVSVILVVYLAYFGAAAERIDTQ